jgi:dTDP-4-amino-4,6-dideoxygalactose transaminase
MSEGPDAGRSGPAPLLLPTDPRACFLAHRAEIEAAMHEALEGGAYILGPAVTAFEREFARFIGDGYVIGVASGTDALVLALRGAGIGPGDRVFTVSHTAVATVAAVELAGAAPVLVDVDPRTLTIDPDRLDGAVRCDSRPARRRAVIAVHLYGQAADMPAVLDVARRHDLVVVEDCAQAHGARLDGRPVGTFGAAAAFSFYPTKNLGALGDGGAVFTTDGALAERVRELRQYGWRERYISEVPGMNSRLDELQAAILRVKLRYLDQENAARARVAGRYRALLAGTELALPEVRPDASHVWHQFVVRSPRRDSLRQALQQAGIGTLVHYPLAVHQQPGYRGRLALDPSGLAHTEAAAREVLSLPMHGHLGEEDVERVGAQIIRLSTARSR